MSHASVSTTNKHGDTSLHNAARAGGPTAVQLIIDAGADVNARNRVGQVPLLLAALHRHTAATALLAFAGMFHLVL